MKPVICVIPLEHSRRTCCIPTDQQRQGGGQAPALSLALNVPSYLLLFSLPQCLVLAAWHFQPAIDAMSFALLRNMHSSCSSFGCVFCLQIFVFLAINIQIRAFLGLQQLLELILEWLVPGSYASPQQFGLLPPPTPCFLSCCFYLNISVEIPNLQHILPFS